MKVELSTTQMALIVEALDSHMYWQLSEPLYRNDGFVLSPGSDDPDDAASIKQAEILQTFIEAAQRTAEATTRTEIS